jgi:hypothetical protein
MKKLRSTRGVLTVISLLLTPAAASAAVIDSINGNLSPGFYVFGPGIGNIGWSYTPSFSYNLTGISSLFEAVPNASAYTRPVTFELENAPGGAVLATGTVNIGNGGGASGVTFVSPLTVAAGTHYFVGLENIGGLGINIVDWTYGQAPGTVNLDGWHYGSGANNFSNYVAGTAFDAPILNFSGTAINPAVPEPSTWALLLLGFAGLGVAAQRRLQTKTA